MVICKFVYVALQKALDRGGKSLAQHSLVGSRIRARRLTAEMKQAELARRAGISASYLNLIEHNRRRIGGKLLNRLAAALDVEPGLLAEGAEAALVAHLNEAAAALPEAGAERARAEEFAGRFPGWAGVIAQQQRRIARLEAAVVALGDRLAHDPQLDASLHEVLSTATAIRATAAILVEGGDVPAEWQARFHRNIDEEAARLAESARALVRFLDAGTGEGAGNGAGTGGAEGEAARPAAALSAATAATAPADEVEQFLARHDWHFPALEPEAAGADAVPGLLEAATDLRSASARAIARQILQRMAEDAAALPLSLCARVTGAAGADPAALAAAGGTGLAAAMRRLAGLPPALLPGPLGLVICDASGAMTFRRPFAGFAVPRFGGGCPLWPLYEALSRPGAPLRRLLDQAGRGGGRALALAVAEPAEPPAFDAPPRLEAHMLLRAPGQEADTPARPVGVTCRICPREGCRARREPSILAAGF